MGGRGSAGASSGSSKASSQKLYTEKNGVRTYLPTREGEIELKNLSESIVHWNKGADITKRISERGQWVKRGKIIETLEKKDINSFILHVPKADEKRALKFFSDYGYNLVAKSGFNEKLGRDSKIADMEFYLSRKKMQYLGLDFKVKTYYKRGVKR